MYLPSFELTNRGPLFVALRIVPFRLRRMRLDRATQAELEALVEACQRFGTDLKLLDDRGLVTPIPERT